jgi:LysM repeat protein
MLSNNVWRWAFVGAFASMMLAVPRPALAWSECGPTYVAQSGDTLGSVSEKCGITVDDLYQANPNVGYMLESGQTLVIPGDFPDGGFYDGCQSSDCYGFQKPGNCYGYSGPGGCDGLQSAPPYFSGPQNNGCYSSACGPIVYAQYQPPTGGTYVVRPGDTMRIIADRLRVPLGDLIAANPQIWNPALIYVGQVICLPPYPAKPAYYQPGLDRGHGPHDFDHKQTTYDQYTVQPGERLRDIARKFDTTQEDLLKLNPSLLGKPGRIYVGMVLQIR